MLGLNSRSLTLPVGKTVPGKRRILAGLQTDWNPTCSGDSAFLSSGKSVARKSLTAPHLQDRKTDRVEWDRFIKMRQRKRENARIRSANLVMIKVLESLLDISGRLRR